MLAEAAKGFSGFNAMLGYKSERLKDLLDNVSPNEDILGLYHIEEHLPTVGTVVLYSCTLCNIKRTMHAIVVLAHVAGFKHRLNFLQCYYPDLLPHDPFPGPNSLHIKSLIRKILHLEKWSKDQIKSSTNSNPTENTDVKIIDKDFRTQLKEMAKQNEPLVGLHYITEHWSKNDPSEVPHYTCRICDVKLPQSSIIEHIIGNQHREIVVYTSYGSIVPVTAKKAERIAVLKTFCTKLEKKENDLFSYEIVYEDPEHFASSIPSNNNEPMKRPLPHDEMPEDEMLRDEMLRDEMPRDEMLRGEMSRGEMTRNEIPRSERAWGEMLCHTTCRTSFATFIRKVH
uniref:Uncharacterized protein n=1 Tax=Eptatretus burgeri TaxID=7764 RepID=A0A8C4QUS3_EPTBU